MLWDPGSMKEDGEKEEHGAVPVTPILVPLQNKPTVAEKNVPLLVPDVQDLKDQFQQQQNMLTQIKETLKQNESHLSSKEKQVEVYANKLSQIRARSKNTHAKKSGSATNLGSSPPKAFTKKSSKENLVKSETAIEEKTPENVSKVGRKGKISELKKCLEENKIKFEQRTGKEQSETKKIESLVEQLKTQLEERDKTIQDLQKNIEQPTPKPDFSAPRKSKQKSDKESVASKTTQTTRTQPSDESIEVIALQNRIYELEANVLDLEENLKEKESVIEARTQAVTLLSQDLSLKGKNTLESLEETRQEMRTMQTNFVAIEDELKKDLAEKVNRLTALEEKCKRLESTNFELSVKNAEQQEKLVHLQEKYLEADSERKSLKESTTVQGESEDKIEELTKKINSLTKELDDRNKSMIKMKIEHKNKVKNLYKTVETLKETSDDKAEIVRLNNLLEEFENVKVGLENRVAELEDEKASEKNLKDQINELEFTIQKLNEESSQHLETISNLKREKSDQNILIENLKSKVENFEDLGRKFEVAEAEFAKKIENLKAEHKKEVEMMESFYNSKMETVERRELEEYRISTEINNIHVEEQIELLVREKQQLLEKLKSLSGVSSTDSLNFGKIEHSDLRDDKEISSALGAEVGLNPQQEENRISHLQRIVNDQQLLINELLETVAQEKQKAANYQQNITELESTIKQLEERNATFKQQIELSEATESGKNSKSNVNAKNRIKKIEMELIQGRKTIAEQNEKLKELNQKLEEKEELIRSYTEKIELFEKEDWDRQNHWKSGEDDIETVQELQKKCLGLENSLIELNEDCERLRKENIEVVHLLSEEKVKRRKLLEELEANPDSVVEERIAALSQVLRSLEEKIEKLETCHLAQSVENAEEQTDIGDLQGKLEWANVVLTGKETEIFRLQNLLEDRCKSIEILEGDLAESRSKLGEKDNKVSELAEELKAKEVQLEEISGNFEKLQECLNITNEKMATSESQIKQLLATVKQMEEDVFRKESELQEIKGTLAEKNLDITNLKNRLEEVNSDLTYSYQEHLENMGKCLRDKESNYEALLVEKNHLEDVNRNLTAEKEDVYNQKTEMAMEREKILAALSEKEKLVAELTEKLKTASAIPPGENKNQNMEEMKIKMKKLAANLKKKAQNEADLLKQVKELEEVISEKDKLVAGMKEEVKDAKEKWAVEKSEKEQMQKDLTQIALSKADLEEEKAALRGKVEKLEKDLENVKLAYENQTKELGMQIQRLTEGYAALQAVEQHDKGKIKHLEGKVSELLQFYETAQENNQIIEEDRKATEEVLQKLAEITGKYEELKFKHNEILMEKSDLEKRFEELSLSASQNSSFDAKIQENFAVIENLEAELKKTQDRMKTVEEKFFYSEERRQSLESKNEEMCKKIMEDSETLVTIDDLSVRVEELLKSEKVLQDSVRNLEAANSELKQALEETQNEKFNLQMAVKVSEEKTAEMSRELKQLKDCDSDKANDVRGLTKEVEKLKAENKQILSEFEKLNQDYEQFEVDYKESLETSQALEKSLKHKIEELNNENAALLEKINQLGKEGSQQQVEDEEKKPKKRKSVTFRSDEKDYIKDLKKQLHSYTAKLKEANEEVENLKAELFRERIRNEVENVVTEAREKVESLSSTPEKKLSIEPEIVKAATKLLTADKPSPDERKFDASVFFGSETAGSFFDKAKSEEQQGGDLDSFMWDDGWGADGQLEEQFLSERVAEANDNKQAERNLFLESEVKRLEEEKQNLTKELQDSSAKYAKAIRKLKELKAGNEKLQSEISKLKTRSGFGDLDAAIVDELKSQIQNMEAKEKELMKALDSAKTEKDSLLKRIDVLNAGNEKFLEMKERQDNEAEIWQRKNTDLLKEISDLRQQLENPQVPDDDLLMKENRELKNKAEALEWKICELNELLEEKQEMLEGKSSAMPSASDDSDELKKVTEEKTLLQNQIEELRKAKEIIEKQLMNEEKKNSETIEELNEKVNALVAENETLQDILGKMKDSSDAAKKEQKESKIFDYFKSAPEVDLFPVAKTQEPHVDFAEVERLKTQVHELDAAINSKNAEIHNLMLKISELEELIRIKEENFTRGSSALQQRISELEKSANAKEEAQKANETFETKLSELENSLNLRDNEVQHLRNTISERENEMSGLRQSIFDLEGLLMLRDQEIHQLKMASEKEIESLKQKTPKVPQTPALNTFETIDLTQSPESSFEREDPEILRQRIFELESLLTIKEEELVRFNESKGQEIENLRQKAFQLEDMLRLRDEEISRLQPAGLMPNSEKELEELRQKTKELEEFISYKEGEIYQIQTLKNSEIQNLEMKIFDLENILNVKDQSESRIFELENLLRFREEETHRLMSEKANEIEMFRQKVLELENLLPIKDQEISQLLLKLGELEKSYNDSKLEIERLLNEENLNTEEKFVEPFQKNIQIPVAFEVEALSRTLNEEKEKSENLKYELSEKEKLLQAKTEEVEVLNSKIVNLSGKVKELEEEEGRKSADSNQKKVQLEKIISDLQQELESSNLQLSVTRRELEEFQNIKDEAMSNLKSQLTAMETELVEAREKSRNEIEQLTHELNEKSRLYDEWIQTRRAEDSNLTEELKELQKIKKSLEEEVERLRTELASKETEVWNLSEMLREERSQLAHLTEDLEDRENQIADLRQTLIEVQGEITQFRNFEKQIKELRAAQMKEAGADVEVTPEGHPDLSDWSEHELVELSSRLQSDLDTALYMLHQRDVRCDELTFELMQLLEERDTLQLRLSTALRINEELRAVNKIERTSSSESLQESKDLVDQSNDRQADEKRVPSEDLRRLASKISELHSVSYLRDKTVKDDSVQRHKEQMNLISRISDSDISLTRDVQSSPAVLLNWVRGRTLPKVMHI